MELIPNIPIVQTKKRTYHKYLQTISMFANSYGDCIVFEEKDYKLMLKEEKENQYLRMIKRYIFLTKNSNDLLLALKGLPPKRFKHIKLNRFDVADIKDIANFIIHGTLSKEHLYMLCIM